MNPLVRAQQALGVLLAEDGPGILRLHLDDDDSTCAPPPSRLRGYPAD